MGFGDELEKVPIAGLIAGEDGEVERESVVRVAGGVLAGSHIAFDADDRLDAGFLRSGIELDCAVEIAVVGNGNRFLAQVNGPRHQLVDMAHSVEEAVVGMVM